MAETISEDSETPDGSLVRAQHLLRRSATTKSRSGLWTLGRHMIWSTPALLPMSANSGARTATGPGCTRQPGPRRSISAQNCIFRKLERRSTRWCCQARPQRFLSGSVANTWGIGLCGSLILMPHTSLPQRARGWFARPGSACRTSMRIRSPSPLGSPRARACYAVPAVTGRFARPP